MSLVQPPIQSTVLDAQGKLVTNWTQWIYNLYTAIGGQAGAGAYFLNTRIDDIHTASTVYLVIPRAGIVTSVSGIIQGTVLTTAETVTIKNSSSNTLGILTFPSSSTAGTVKTTIPTSNNIINAQDYLKITSSGLSSSSVACWFTVTVQYL